MAKIKIDKDTLEKMETDLLSFGLGLSALVYRHGTKNEETGKIEYLLRVNDFHAISESDFTIENEMVDGEPGTWVRLRLKTSNGGNKVDQKEESI